MNEKHDALIKRIDKLIKIIESGDTLLNGTTWEILHDCRAALSQSEPVRYVPMADDEISEMMQDWYNDTTVHTELTKYIESAVIRRAGLEVSNDAS